MADESNTVSRSSRRWWVAIVVVACIVAIVLVIVLTRRGATSVPNTTPPVETCEISCQAMRTCGLATTTCIADCKTNHEVRACTDLALANKCGEAAMCGLRATCGVVQLGQSSCKAAMLCQSGVCHEGDIACGCTCMHDLAARNVLALLRVDVCAMNCRYDQTCIEQRCMVWLQACFAQ